MYIRRWSYKVPPKRRYTFTVPHCITSHKRGIIIYIATKAFWLSSGILYEASFLHKLFPYNILCSTILRWNSWILYLALSYKICCPEIHIAICTLIKLQLFGSITVPIIMKTKLAFDERNLIDLAIVQCKLRTDVYSDWLSNLISVV